MRLDRGVADLPRDQRWAGVSAIVAFLVFTAGNLLWALDQPVPNATGPELVAFYKDSASRIVTGGSLSLISVAIFVVFGASVSSVLKRLTGDALLGKIAFGGILLGCAAGLGAESINMAAAIRADDGTLTEPLAEALFDISYMFGSYAGGVGFGLAMVAIGAAALQSRALLPRWLAMVFVVVGVALVTPLTAYLIGEYALAPSFLLLFVLGVLLIRGSAQPAAMPPG